MAEQSFSFPPKLRLHSRADFSRVFEDRVRESRGPLTAYAVPNDLGHYRMGISIGRATRPAPRRNRIKRLLRESFRHQQQNLPGAYDMVIVVRPHTPFPLAEYQRLLASMANKFHVTWQKRLGPRV